MGQVKTLRGLLRAAIVAREELQAFEKENATADCDRGHWRALWDACDSADKALEPVAGRPGIEQARAILEALSHEREAGYQSGYSDGYDDGHGEGLTDGMCK